MAGYIGGTAVVSANGAERKKTYTITGATTSLTGLSYTVSQVHVFHNGVRLVDGTDFTATNGNSITLTSAAESGDEVVVLSYAGYQVSDTVSASQGGTFSGDVTVSGAFTSQGIDDNASATAMTLDALGNLLVGKASADSGATAGFEVNANGRINAVRDGGISAVLNRLNSDGDILQLRKDGSTIGRIGSTVGGGIYIQGQAYNTLTNNGELVSIRDSSGGDRLLLGGVGAYGFIGDRSGSGAGIAFVSTSVRPFSTDDMNYKDNAFDLGTASFRWDDLYATNGTIQTSDRNEKQDIAALTATEMLVAARISAMFKTFRWIDKVADNPNARTHTGIIAQDVQQAFTDEGLDAGDYSLFVSTTWDDENGNSQTRMGIRYPELLSFIAAYNEQRFASIETRLAALEAN